ncbi:MAG: aldo/keto reductase [Candidatus Eisenbacteria bacterium]|nr:aldo/keto reductase [Candidatus Eisenbacteria bacterium]
MNTVRLGRTGLKVSRLCMGTMTFGNQCDEAASRAILDRAWDAGVYFIDTADMYPLGAERAAQGRTEEIVGRWLKDTGRRDRAVLATKCRVPMGDGPNDGGLSRGYILRAVEASLRRLQTEFIDLYYAHSSDPATPIEETMDAFDSLVRAGKVRYLGASNYQAWEFARALWASDRLGLHRYDVQQPRYNALFRYVEQDTLPLCRDQEVAVFPYNPLAGGLLTHRYRKGQEVEPGTRFALEGATRAGQVYRNRYWSPGHFDAVEDLAKFFAARGRDLGTAAVAWVLRQPGITGAIIGASRAEQLGVSLAAVDMELDAEEMAALDGAWYRLPKDPNPKTATR